LNNPLTLALIEEVKCFADAKKKNKFCKLEKKLSDTMKVIFDKVLNGFFVEFFSEGG
jgi:NTP pyrophosphatase (non-canonical NTP hydrolase)